MDKRILKLSCYMLLLTCVSVSFLPFSQVKAVHYEVTLNYGEVWGIRPAWEERSGRFIATWSFVGSNSLVDITMKYAYYSQYADGLAGDNTTGTTLIIAHAASGEDDDLRVTDGFLFWHLDELASGETTTLSIDITVVKYYLTGWFLALYIGGPIFLTILIVSIVVLSKRKKKKVQQEIAQPSSFTPTTSQPDSPPNDLPPPPPPDYSEGTKIFCWKCGQPNTSQTSYCIKCGSDIHNPER